MSTYFLEAEGGEGLEAAVLKTIFRFPPHTHDLVVHVHLQSGAIQSNQQQSWFAIRVCNQSISRQYSLSVAISRHQSQPVAISRHQSPSVAYRHLGGYEELIAELAHVRDARRNQGGAAEIDASGGSEGEGGIGDVDACEASEQRT